MTTDSKTTDAKADAKKTQESTVAAARVPAAGVSAQALLTTPIVIKREKAKKKGDKKKYTRGTKGVQRLILGVSKAAARSANSVSDGLDTFAKESSKSGRKKRDGLVRDSLRNASRGISDGLTELGKAPDEIARRIGTRRVWRTFRVFTPIGW